MLRVGLTGGIGAGKSEVARLLAARGAVIVDSDALARKVVAPGTPGLRQVVERFGEHVLAPDGSLDRAALAAIVFHDEQARADLNAIVHPLVGAAAIERMSQAPPGAIVVQDVPLLVETGMAPAFDAVIVVEAPLDARLERLASARGMRRDDALARIATQATDEQRRAVASYVVVNNAGIDQLEREVDTLWAALRAAARAQAAGHSDTVR